VGELMTLPQIPIRLERGHREPKYPYCAYFSSRCPLRRRPNRRSKANMSWIFLKIPPGISWKSPGNLLD